MSNLKAQPSRAIAGKEAFRAFWRLTEAAPWNVVKSQYGPIEYMTREAALNAAAFLRNGEIGRRPFFPRELR
jgi:hypothetical protein